jgi:dCTP diphosphatase
VLVAETNDYPSSSIQTRVTEEGRTLAMQGEMEALRDALRKFAADRDWDQFHSPKNLASALAVEAAELLEHFQWLTEAQSKDLPSDARAKVIEELADVFGYLIRLADKLDVDLIAAAHDKIAHNAQKYPIEKSRGNAKKYTEL